MNAKQIEKLITRRASKGYNAAESRTLLNELLAAHHGDNLAHALTFQAFTA